MVGVTCIYPNNYVRIMNIYYTSTHGVSQVEFDFKGKLVC